MRKYLKKLVLRNGKKEKMYRILSALVKDVKETKLSHLSKHHKKKLVI